MNNLALVFHIKSNNSESTICQIEPWMVQLKDNTLTYPDSKISDLNFDNYKAQFTSLQIKLIQLCKELSVKEIEKYFNKNTKKPLSLNKLLIDNRISLLIHQKTTRIISDFIKIEAPKIQSTFNILFFLILVKMKTINPSKKTPTPNKLNNSKSILG